MQICRYYALLSTVLIDFYANLSVLCSLIDSFNWFPCKTVGITLSYRQFSLISMQICRYYGLLSTVLIGFHAKLSVLRSLIDSFNWFPCVCRYYALLSTVLIDFYANLSVLCSLIDSFLWFQCKSVGIILSYRQF